MKKLTVLVLLLSITISLFSCTTKTNSKKADEYFIKETIHFKIYYTKIDKSSIDSITNKLEDNYERVIKDLNAKNIPLMTVKIFPSKEAFNKELGTTNEIAVGAAINESLIYIVSPNNPGPKHTYDIIMDAFVHEFTHSAILNAYPKAAIGWCWESIPVYEAKQRFDKNVDINNLPSISDLNYASVDGKVYAYGYYIAGYIVDKWGAEGIKKLLESNAHVDEAFGVTTEEFDKGWHEFLKLNINK